MADVEFQNTGVEKRILKHLLQNSSFFQNSMMYERVVENHFTSLFHLDSFNTIRSYYSKYGIAPPDKDKFTFELEKNFTPADSFSSRENQLQAWIKSAKRLYAPLTEDEKRELDADFDILEELRKKRIIQNFLYYGNKQLEAGDVDDIIERMADEVNASKAVENIVMEGNIVDDWSQHEALFKRIEDGEFLPVASGIKGAVENLESNTHRIILLDDLIDGGFFAGELTLIVGENSVGKSFALMEIAYFAAKSGINVLFFTIEMNKIKQQRRIYSRLAGVPYNKFKKALLTEDEKKLIKKKLKIWKHKCGLLHIVSFDKGATVVDIRNKTKDAENKYGCKFGLIVIDYLNDMKPIGRYQSNKNWDAMGEISWDLAQYAKYYNNHQGIPIVTANQKKTSRAGTDTTGWADAAFSPLPSQHATVGIGIGQNDDDREFGRLRWDIFKTRDSGGKGHSFFTFPNFEISRISSLKKLNDYYIDLYEDDEYGDE